MPRYDYLCKCCDKEFEVDQSIKDDPGASCPSCMIWSTNRLISKNTNFSLKGSGWAADNYSSKK